MIGNLYADGRAGADLKAAAAAAAFIADDGTAVLKADGIHKTGAAGAGSAAGTIAIDGYLQAGHAVNGAGDARVKIGQNIPQAAAWAAITDGQ